MSEYRLRSYDQSPPGGYPYRQEGSKPRTFTAVPLIESQARNVESYRKSNGLPRATYPESLVDVDRYQCIRMGNNPQYCIPCESQSQSVAVAANAPGLVPCGSCGARVE